MILKHDEIKDKTIKEIIGLYNNNKELLEFINNNDVIINIEAMALKTKYYQEDLNLVDYIKPLYPTVYICDICGCPNDIDGICEFCFSKELTKC